MAKSKFSLTNYKDEAMLDLVRKTDHRILARWAIDCAERVLPYFEDKCPSDDRLRQALVILMKWIKTGEFKMSEIRLASLNAHAAARAMDENSPARAAARAAGQAVATAHVLTHSMGAAIYALQAIHRATGSDDKWLKEQAWQLRHLLELKQN